MDVYFGYTGLISIFITLTCIIITWWAIQGLDFKVLSKNPKSLQLISLQIIIATIIGYQLAQFFIDYLSWSLNLKNLF